MGERPKALCGECWGETEGYRNGETDDPLQWRHLDSTLAGEDCKRIPPAPKCWCILPLTVESGAADFAGDAAGQAMSYVCSKHGVWTDAAANYARMMELEAERDGLRKGIILVRKMMDNPDVYRTEPGLLSDLLRRALEDEE